MQICQTAQIVLRLVQANAKPPLIYVSLQKTEHVQPEQNHVELQPNTLVIQPQENAQKAQQVHITVFQIVRQLVLHQQINMLVIQEHVQKIHQVHLIVFQLVNQHVLSQELNFLVIRVHV